MRKLFVGFLGLVGAFVFSIQFMSFDTIMPDLMDEKIDTYITAAVEKYVKKSTTVAYSEPGNPTVLSVELWDQEVVSSIARKTKNDSRLGGTNNTQNMQWELVKKFIPNYQTHTHNLVAQKAPFFWSELRRVPTVPYVVGFHAFEYEERTVVFSAEAVEVFVGDTKEFLNEQIALFEEFATLSDADWRKASVLYTEAKTASIEQCRVNTLEFCKILNNAGLINGTTQYIGNVQMNYKGRVFTSLCRNSNVNNDNPAQFYADCLRTLVAADAK
jgi:hypothetical protein